MNTIKIYLLKLVTILIFITYQLASGQSNWNASIGGQFQYSQLKANSDFFDTEKGNSGGMNIGISYTSNKNWSLHSGLGLGFIKNKNTIRDFSGTQNTQDIEGENFEFRYRLQNYSEEQKSTTISIPIASQYETNGKSTRFYAKLGFSLDLFINPKVQAKSNELSTSGFFERLNAEINEPRFAGFGDFNPITFSEQDLAIKNSFNVFWELGIKQNVTTNEWLYIGLFIEYGLNNIMQPTKNNLIEYNQNDPTDFKVNSILNSRNQTTGQDFTDKLNLTKYGIKLVYEFKI